MPTVAEYALSPQGIETIWAANGESGNGKDEAMAQANVSQS